MGIRALDSTAMNLLQAVILAVLAIGVTSEKPPCQPGKNAQVVLSDPRTRQLYTWSPDNCVPETFKSYPVPEGTQKYAATLNQCNGTTFVTIEGNTQIVVYNKKTGTWNFVTMPKKLKKVINYAVTCWGSQLLVIGGRIPNGPNGNNATPKDTIWALDYANQENYRWEKQKVHLVDAIHGSCATTSGDLLTVMSGLFKPLKLNKKVYIYNLKTGEVRRGSEDIDVRIDDCKNDDARPDPFVFAVRGGSEKLQAYAINPYTGKVGQYPSIDKRYLGPYQIMFLPQQENWLTVVSNYAPEIAMYSNAGDRPVYVFVYNEERKEWKQTAQVPPLGAMVLGVIQ